MSVPELLAEFAELTDVDIRACLASASQIGSWESGGAAMNAGEETIKATLDSSGQLQLSHPPRLRPGPVQVTIRVAAEGPPPGLADVIREIAAEQRSRGFPGRSEEDLRAEDEARLAEDDERDRELDAAPHGLTRGAMSAVLSGHGDRHLRRRGKPYQPATCAWAFGRATEPFYPLIPSDTALPTHFTSPRRWSLAVACF